jgi:hypothetical protein
MLNGLHLLIVALNPLSGECGQVTEQYSGTVIRSRREVQFRQREWRRVVVISAFPALMPKSIYWTVATKQFNMRLCRYTGSDLVGVLTLLSWGWTSDGYVNGPPKSIYDERSSGRRPPYLVAHHAGLPKRRREHT